MCVTLSFSKTEWMEPWLRGPNFQGQAKLLVESWTPSQHKQTLRFGACWTCLATFCWHYVIRVWSFPYSCSQHRDQVLPQVGSEQTNRGHGLPWRKQICQSSEVFQRIRPWESESGGHSKRVSCDLPGYFRVLQIPHQKEKQKWVRCQGQAPTGLEAASPSWGSTFEHNSILVLFGLCHFIPNLCK